MLPKLQLLMRYPERFLPLAANNNIIRVSPALSQQHVHDARAAR
jgi:hypothetical protein